LYGVARKCRGGNELEKGQRTGCPFENLIQETAERPKKGRKRKGSAALGGGRKSYVKVCRIVE